MNPKAILAKLNLSFQCPVDWEAMKGDDQNHHGQNRFCQKCQKTVTDLSTLSAEEAAQFVLENEGACLRIWRDQDGQIVTKPCPTNQHLTARRVATRTLAAGALALSACSPATQDLPQNDSRFQIPDSPSGAALGTCLPTMGVPLPIEKGS